MNNIVFFNVDKVPLSDNAEPAKQRNGNEGEGFAKIFNMLYENKLNCENGESVVNFSQLVSQDKPGEANFSYDYFEPGFEELLAGDMGIQTLIDDMSELKDLLAFMENVVSSVNNSEISENIVCETSGSQDNYSGEDVLLELYSHSLKLFEELIAFSNMKQVSHDLTENEAKISYLHSESVANSITLEDGKISIKEEYSVDFSNKEAGIVEQVSLNKADFILNDELSADKHSLSDTSLKNIYRQNELYEISSNPIYVNSGDTDNDDGVLPEYAKEERRDFADAVRPLQVSMTVDANVNDFGQEPADSAADPRSLHEELLPSKAYDKGIKSDSVDNGDAKDFYADNDGTFRNVADTVGSKTFSGRNIADGYEKPFDNSEQNAKGDGGDTLNNEGFSSAEEFGSGGDSRSSHVKDVKTVGDEKNMLTEAALKFESVGNVLGSAEFHEAENIPVKLIADNSVSGLAEFSCVADSVEILKGEHQVEVRETGSSDTFKVSDILYSAVKKGLTKITVKIAPEHLGKLEIQLTEKNGRLSVEIFADNRETGKIIAGQTEAIIKTLFEKGINIESMDLAFNDTTSKRENKGRKDDGSKAKKPSLEDDETGKDKKNEIIEGIYA